MLTDYDCIPCFLSQALRAAKRAGATQDQTATILHRSLQHLDQSSWDLTPPELGSGLYRIVAEETGMVDPFAEEKVATNLAAEALIPALRQRIKASGDPLATAARLAVSGNVLDLGVFAEVDAEVARRAVEETAELPLTVNHTPELRDALAHLEGYLLYVADNAGEIFFDRLLVEQILAIGVRPEQVVFMVRGGPAINDALLADAVHAGIPELVRVVDTGAAIPGLVLAKASEEARALYAGADVVIAKGMGNYESLPSDDPRTFFLLRVKCAHVARLVALPLGSEVVLQGGSLQEAQP